MSYQMCEWGYGPCTAPDTICPHWAGTVCELDVDPYARQLKRLEIKPKHGKGGQTGAREGGKMMELKPCPFCGSDDVEIHRLNTTGYGHQRVVIRCNCCYMLFSTYGSEPPYTKKSIQFEDTMFQLEEMLKKHWNRRANDV